MAWYKGTDCASTNEKVEQWTDGQVLNLKVKISNQTLSLIPPSIYDAIESYTFQLENDTILITAPQYSGAMRGLATFTQLVK
jgi:beta-acetyl hexosaminidase like